MRGQQNNLFANLWSMPRSHRAIRKNDRLASIQVIGSSDAKAGEVIGSLRTRDAEVAKIVAVIDPIADRAARAGSKASQCRGPCRTPHYCTATSGVARGRDSDRATAVASAACNPRRTARNRPASGGESPAVWSRSRDGAPRAAAADRTGAHAATANARAAAAPARTPATRGDSQERKRGQQPPNMAR